MKTRIAQAIKRQAAGCRAEIRYPEGATYFFLFRSDQRDSGAHPVSYTMYMGGGVKRQRTEANYSPPTCVEFKNVGAILPHPQTPSRCCAQLIKRREDFTL
jgi:hypothetical protein